MHINSRDFQALKSQALKSQALKKTFENKICNIKNKSMNIINYKLSNINKYEFTYKSIYHSTLHFYNKF